MQKKNIFQSRKGAYCIMVIPALVWMVLINIVPMFGIIMAFLGAPFFLYLLRREL